MSWLGGPPLLLFRGIGGPEIIIILAVLFLIFGASRLPKISSSLGQSLRAFKNAITGQDEADSKNTDDRKVKPAAKEEEKP